MKRNISYFKSVDGLVICLLLLVVATQIIRDPSPWRDQFYEAARFEGQLGIAGNYTQAASGRSVDCLIWPGLPGIAMGGLLVKITGVTNELISKDHKIKVPATELYKILNNVSKIGNILAVVGVILLVLGTYALILGITSRRGVSFLTSLYLGSSQIVATQVGWLRPEVWSLSFLVLAFIAILPELRDWINNDSNRSVHKGLALRQFLGGFFVASAMLEKINVVPGVMIYGVLCLAIIWQSKINYKKSSVRPVKNDIIWLFLPIILLPWWAFVFPDKSFWNTVSVFDSGTAAALGVRKWHEFTAILILLSFIPLASWITTAFIKRLNRKNDKYDRLHEEALTLGRLTAGGLFALILWGSLISKSLNQFQLHITQTMVMIASTLFGANIFAQTHVGCVGIIHYIVESGKLLSRPNLADAADLLNQHLDISNLFNSTFVATAMAMWVAVRLMTSIDKSKHMIRLTVFGIGFWILMIASDYLASTRGVYDVDFRYFAYAGWFGLISAACSFSVILELSKSPRTSIVMRCAGVLFGITLSLILIKGGIQTRSENALFGRQIYIAPQCAPNLFKDAGFVPKRSDWHLLLSWKAVDFPKVIQEEGDTPERIRQFNCRTLDDNSIIVKHEATPSPKCLQLKIPIEVNQSGMSANTIVVKALLQSSHQNRMPAVGISTEDRKTGSVMQSKWANISSAWGPGVEPEEYACSVPFDPKKQNVFVNIYWGPKEKDESISIKDLAVGFSIN